MLIWGNSNNTAMDSSTYMTVKQVCEYLHISRTTLYNHIQTKKITAYKIGRRLLFKQSDIEDAVTELEVLSII